MKRWKNKRKKERSMIICLLFCTKSLMGQDPHFSQFYANQLYLNPAFAGSGYCPRLMINYRNQWPGLSGNFVTYSASFDQYVQAMSGGFGLSFFHDMAGEWTLNTTSASLMYSYTKNITRNILGFLEDFSKNSSSPYVGFRPLIISADAPGYKNPFW